MFFACQPRFKFSKAIFAIFFGTLPFFLPSDVLAQAVTIAEKRGMVFGLTGSSSEGAGSVTLSADGTVTYSGFAGDFGKNFTTGQFNLTGPKNGWVLLTLPSSATISSGGSSTTLHSFTSNPASPFQLGKNGRLTIDVGATMDVPTSLTPGDYAGTFTVFADPQ